MILEKDDVIVWTRAKKHPASDYDEGEPMRTVAKPIVIEGFEAYSFFIDKRFDEWIDGETPIWWCITEAQSGGLIVIDEDKDDAILGAGEILRRKGKEELDKAIKASLDKFGPLPA